VISRTAVLHSVVSDGSFCCDTMPVTEMICHSARTTIGLMRRSQPLCRQLRPRPGRSCGAAVTPATGRLPAPAAGSAGLPRLLALVLVDTDTVEPLPW